MGEQWVFVVSLAKIWQNNSKSGKTITVHLKKIKAQNEPVQALTVSRTSLITFSLLVRTQPKQNTAQLEQE